MPSVKSLPSLKPGLAPLNRGSNPSLPPLENVSLNMPIDMSTLSEKTETSHPEKDTSTSSELEVEKPVRAAKFKKLEKQYADQMKKIAVLVFPFSPEDGKSLLENADILADTTIGYAEVNKDFCSALESLLNATPLIAMISAYASVVSAILSNHGINPVENMMKARMEKMNGKASLPGFSSPLQA